MGIIISSFIGCGREYLTNTHGNKIKIMDMSNVPLDIENDETLEGYYNEVMDCVDENDIVFIGGGDNVRRIFDSHHTDYDLFYPSINRKLEFIENQVRKRTKPDVIREIDTNFEKWVNEIEENNSENCYKHKLSNNGEFIGNTPIIMQYIYSIIDKKASRQDVTRTEGHQQEMEEKNITKTEENNNGEDSKVSE